MQNAIWMDMAAFISTYPELQHALKYALGALVKYIIHLSFLSSLKLNLFSPEPDHRIHFHFWQVF